MPSLPPSSSTDLTPPAAPELPASAPAQAPPPALQGAARARRILALALPIVGGMLSQNLLNLVDTFMVGRLGNAALAGVGLASFATFLSLALITGLSAGVQAISARRLGEGQTTQTALSLNGGLLLAFVIGAPLSILVYFGAAHAFPLLVKQPEIVEVGVGYWQARALSIVAVGLNFSFRGFWNGISESWRYFVTLLIMHISNIIISYGLIFGAWGLPEMGATGAGLGSSIATWIGTLVYLLQGLLRARPMGFLRSLPSRAVLRSVLRLSVPAGVQQLFFSAGMTAFFSIIGRVGVAELAASQVLLNLLMLAILPGMGFGLAAGSLVGHALGGGSSAQARDWGWSVARLAVLVIGLLVLPGIFFPEHLLAPFLTDPVALELAAAPMLLVCVGIPIDTLGLVLMQSLIGAGDSRRTLIVATATQWGVALPLAYLLGPVLGFGITAIWACHVASRVLNTLIFTAMWKRGGWTQIRV